MRMRRVTCRTEYEFRCVSVVRVEFVIWSSRAIDFIARAVGFLLCESWGGIPGSCVSHVMVFTWTRIFTHFLGNAISLPPLNFILGSMRIRHQRSSSRADRACGCRTLRVIILSVASPWKFPCGGKFVDGKNNVS